MDCIDTTYRLNGGEYSIAADAWFWWELFLFGESHVMGHSIARTYEEWHIAVDAEC